VYYLQDKDFGKQAIYRAHVNPPATIVSKIKAYQKYFIKKAYIGEDVFWGLSPTAGDTVEIKFDPAIEIARYDSLYNFSCTF
jgi:alpha-1,3-mannosylglycoprotein beta-1,4-N-acetylglucosaminyltransferase A/B